MYLATALLTFSPSLFNAAFWKDVFAQTPTKVIILAGLVALLTQTIKKFAPNLISGKIAIAVNVASSIAAVFVGMDPAHFWTQTTLMQVIAIILAAAGIHSTGKSLTAPSSGDTPDPAQDLPANSAMQYDYNSKEENANKNTAIRAGIGNSTAIVFLAIALLSGSSALTGCVKGATAATPPLATGAIDQIDNDANKTLQPIHAFAASLSADVQSGKLSLSRAAYGPRHVE